MSALVESGYGNGARANPMIQNSAGFTVMHYAAGIIRGVPNDDRIGWAVQRIANKVLTQTEYNELVNVGTNAGYTAHRIASAFGRNTQRFESHLYVPDFYEPEL